jgi:hypothetical protein
LYQLDILPSQQLPNFGPPYDVPSFNLANSTCFALAEFMAPETSAFLYKTDTVHSAWASSTQIILFSDELKRLILFYEGKIKNLMEYLEMSYLSKNLSSNLIYCSTNMCPSCQGIAVF